MGRIPFIDKEYLTDYYVPEAYTVEEADSGPSYLHCRICGRSDEPNLFRDFASDSYPGSHGCTVLSLFTKIDMRLTRLVLGKNVFTTFLKEIDGNDNWCRSSDGTSAYHLELTYRWASLTNGQEPFHVNCGGNYLSPEYAIFVAVIGKDSVSIFLKDLRVDYTTSRSLGWEENSVKYAVSQSEKVWNISSK